jgi:electron transport complex protein RnfD
MANRNKPWTGRSLIRKEPFDRPLVNLAYSTGVRMWLVSACAGLGILQSALTDNFSSLIIALFAVTGALIVELLVDYVSGSRSIRDGSAVASALILTLLLPNSIHPVFALIGSVFAMTVIKHSFGGLGTNWLNPALGAWLFIRIGWPGAFSEALKGTSLSFLTESVEKGFWDPQASPLGILKINNFVPGPLDNLITSFLNKTVFFIAGAELPGGYMSLFFSGSGIIADRGLLGLLLGTIIITASRVSRLWVPLFYLAMYSLLVCVFGALSFGGELGNGDMLFGLLTGGTLVAAFLLAAEPVTGPKSAAGTLLVTVLAAFLSFVFRYLGFEAYGAFFAVCLLNTLVPLIRRVESRSLYFLPGGSNEK